MLQPQQTLCDRYQLLQCLGNNAGRQTWLATDTLTESNQSVIVKFLAFHSEMHWDDYKLFEREGDVLKQLNHPKIPKYQDYFTLEKKSEESLAWFGLVQEYIAGKTLQQLLDEGKKFTEEQVKNIAIQVLEILGYLQEFEPPILHRDIKPSNLILTDDEQVYLIDFGAVQNAAAVEGVTFTVVGTTGYAPLEQLWGKAVPASDLYGLGATLIHLLTGVSPINLPQDNLRIQFCDRISIDSFFIKWIDRLIDPDLNVRLKTANEALLALQNKRFPKDSLESVTLPFSSNIHLQESSHQAILSIPGKFLTIHWNKNKWGEKLLKIGWDFFRLSGIIIMAILILIVMLIILILFNNYGFIRNYFQPFSDLLNFLFTIAQLVKLNLVMHIFLAPGSIIIYSLGQRLKKLYNLSKISQLKDTYIPQIMLVVTLMFLRSSATLFWGIILYLICAWIWLLWFQVEMKLLINLSKRYYHVFNYLLSQLLHNLNSFIFIKIGLFNCYEINLYMDYKLIRLKKQVMNFSKTQSYYISKLNLFYVDKFNNLVIQEKNDKKKQSYYLNLSQQEKLWLSHYLNNRLETLK